MLERGVCSCGAADLFRTPFSSLLLQRLLVAAPTELQTSFALLVSLSPLSHSSSPRLLSLFRSPRLLVSSLQLFSRPLSLELFARALSLLRLAFSPCCSLLQLFARPLSLLHHLVSLLHHFVAFVYLPISSLLVRSTRCISLSPRCITLSPRCTTLSICLSPYLPPP